ncbi:MAG TPA: ester cyclase [Actinomycetota bacterium]|nr:ester cyclase [Actinomycetota bacterium]
MKDESFFPLVRLVEEGFNGGRVELLDEFIHPDLIEHSNAPLIGTGLEAMKQRLIAVRNAFPDAHLDIEDLAASADKVWWRWRFTATHRGDFIGVPPTGKRVETTGVSIERIADGKIVEHWSFSDRLALWDQLGVDIPAAARP